MEQLSGPTSQECSCLFQTYEFVRQHTVELFQSPHSEENFPKFSNGPSREPLHFNNAQAKMYLYPRESQKRIAYLSRLMT